ncbi:MAG: SpoIID/LytB domain-containing protein [Treponema sp.]|nr:SpoIID/LytB domain-containing protein [Treponema sp.]
MKNKTFLPVLLSFLLISSCTRNEQALQISPEPEQEDSPIEITESYTDPIQAYNTGHIEEAVQLLSSSDISFEEQSQLLVMYWELGDNANAANLLEEMIQNLTLPASERNELQLELFNTYVLMGSYTEAAAMRGILDAAVQRMDSRLQAEYYFYNALTYHEMGDLLSAEEYYKKSLDIYRWRALAWYRLGTILLDNSPAEAEEAFQNCWNMDRSYIHAVLPLSRLLTGRGEWVQARNMLIAASDLLPDDPELAEAIEEALTAVLRRIGPPANVFQFVQRQITAVPPTVTPAPITQGEGIMRVGLNVNRPILSVKAGGDFTIYNVETREVLYTGTSQEQFWIRWNGDASFRIHDGNNRTLLTSSAPIIFELSSDRDTSIVAGVVSGSPGLNRTYRGHLEFIPEEGGITAVSIVSMGDYLYGVVPSELPASWPREVLRAQAIASRSYAMAYRGTFADRGFDIWNTALSQTYAGVAVEHGSSTAAVDATRGIILVGEDDEPLAAYYSANHGGHSEDTRTVWGYDAYMEAVIDSMLPERPAILPPGDLYRWIKDNPTTHSNVPGYHFPNIYRWERWISPAEIRRRLMTDSRVMQDPGEIQRIVSRGRGISGRIIELEIQGSEQTITVSRNVIWAVTGGLRSSLFTIRYKKSPEGNIEYFVFNGAGYGHGIGMDQHAAAAMAARGMRNEEILAHFYPRASLRQAYR